jgi:phospholipase/carboxylesterase
VKDKNKTTTIHQNGWVVRVTPPADRLNSRLLLMLHGWTGDETSMKVFYREVPPNHWIIAPRGIIPAEETGYGWVSHRPGREATLELFLEVVDQLRSNIKQWIEQLEINPQPMELIGFSQGAALALAYALKYPLELRSVACISGFLPYLPTEFHPSDEIRNIRFFIAHGIQDDIVEIERARETKRFLSKWGAICSYCEDNVGHRISAACFQKLGEFLKMEAPNSTPTVFGPVKKHLTKRQP